MLYDCEPIGPDPMMVEQLVEAMGNALTQVIIPDVTTQADLLSALFTMLKHALREAEHEATPEERRMNSKEVGRILAGLLMEFGTEQLQ